MMRAISAAVLVTLLAGCAVPYQPESVSHPVPLAAGAFDRVLGVFHDRHARVAVADRDAFRIQTEWLPFQRGDVPGYRRSSVFRGEGGYLNVIVEMYFLELGAGGVTPSKIVGDRRAEQRLAAVLEHVLAR